MKISLSKWISDWRDNGGGRSPHLGTIITLLIIFIGLFGSLYSDEIKSVVPFQWGTWNGWESFHFHPRILFFWVVTIFVGGLYFFREWEVDSYDSQLRKELVSQIQTLPPAEFLQEFADTYDEGEAMYEKALQSKNVDDTKKIIRGLLTCICQLTEKFDSPKQHTQMERYAANIMLFIDASSADKELSEQIQPRIKFIDQEVLFQTLKGALDLRKDLSTHSEAQQSEEDMALEAFALPIPHAETTNIDGKNKYRVLPGAPLAYCESRTELHMQSSEIYKWCEDHGDFTAHVKKQIKEYFSGNGGKQVASFLSIPLMTDRKSKPIGVINIHKNGPMLLVDPKRLLHFDPIIRPYRHMLAKLVQQLLILEKEALSSKKD